MADKNNKQDSILEEILEDIGITPARVKSTIPQEIKNNKNDSIESDKSGPSKPTESIEPTSLIDAATRPEQKNKHQKVYDKEAVRKKNNEYIRDYRKGKKQVLIFQKIIRELTYYYGDCPTYKMVNIILAEHLMKNHPTCKRKMESLLKNIQKDI